jgi:hypothetical protein
VHEAAGTRNRNLFRRFIRGTTAIGWQIQGYQFAEFAVATTFDRELMMSETTYPVDNAGLTRTAPAGRTGAWSGLSWSAVIAGALTAIAVSVIVISLGTGIGMELVSPYSYSSPSAGTMTVMGALWLVFAQAVGFAVGGYVAARLRRLPAGLHTDEVKFRDGANGLVVWAIGVVVSFFIIVAAVDKIGSAAGTAAAGTAAIGAAGAASQAPSVDYFTDALLRQNPQGAGNAGASTGNAGTASAADTNSSAANGANASNSPASNGVNSNQQHAQINRIMVTAWSANGVSDDDRTYLAQLVSQQTGMSQQDAQNRVNDVINRAKDAATQAAEAARKTAAYLSFWTFMSLLFGAACATLGGILGGELRDESATRVVVTTSPR